MQRALQDLTAEFSRQHPDVLFVVRGGGSTVGEELVRRGEADLGASTLFPPEQTAALPAADTGAPSATLQPTLPAPPAGADPLVRVPIGLDGLAAIVHPGNPIAELSLVQLRDIFAGRLLDWVAVGSDAGEIQLVSREDGSGARILFESRIMGDERVALTAVVMPTSADVVAYVARNPQAIGYVASAEVVEWIEQAGGAAGGEVGAPVASGVSATVAPQVKVLRVEGRLPTRAAIRNQEYALTQPLYLVTLGPPANRVRQFIDFVLSPAGQAIVGRYGAPIR
jgi:phosphate transport system substrate-binding protein